MLEIVGLSKRFGNKQALHDVTFSARSGAVTGFLGPNGAGKSTTMRSILGLIRPDAGEILIDGQEYANLKSPLAAVGAVFDAKSAHPRRKAYAHLRAIAITHGIPKSRVDEVIDIAGIDEVKNKKPGGFSLGMNQRLSIAAALLADPQNLVLDEPVNGLDPEGVKWIRDLCRWYASQGRTVLLSSHLMSEVALTADDLVIIGRGSILKSTTVAQFIAENSSNKIKLVTPNPQLALGVLNAVAGVKVVDDTAASLRKDAATLSVEGIDINQLSGLLASNQVPMYELVPEQTSLEDAYLRLTHDEVEYRSHLTGEGAQGIPMSLDSNLDSSVNLNGMPSSMPAAFDQAVPDVQAAPVAGESFSAQVTQPGPGMLPEPEMHVEPSESLAQELATQEESASQPQPADPADDSHESGSHDGGLVVPNISEMDIPQLSLLPIESSASENPTPENSVFENQESEKDGE